MISALLVLAVTVQPGQTLSGIAAAHGTSVSALAAANGIANPDLIYAGQSLRLPGGTGGGTSAGDREPDGDGDDGQAPVSSPVQQVSVGGGSFRSCVIQRESGGNPFAVNPSSGAGGLYQFLPSTWSSLGFGGLPQNASVATQNAAFDKEFALMGTSPWAPYDGCH